jgi:hypothetical protein
MAASDAYAGWLRANGASWPYYAETWMGSPVYPAGRGQQQAATGWECPGCRRCWAPGVLACHYCPQEQPAPAFTGKPGEITDDEYER